MRTLVCTFLVSCCIFSCDRYYEPIETSVFTMRNGIGDVSEMTDNYIIFEGNDTIFFHLGIGINTLTETDPKVIYFPKTSDKDFDDSMMSKFNELENVVISRERIFDMDNYRNQNVIFEEIAGYSAKIVFPRISKGTTGIYIDSLYHGCDGDVYGDIEFNIYGNDLPETVRKEFLRSIRSIEFIEPEYY